MGVHNAVAVVAVVEHNAVVAVVADVVAVGVESQGIVGVVVAAVVEGFAFLDTPEKFRFFERFSFWILSIIHSPLLPFALVEVDTGVAALGAVLEKHIEPEQVG